MTHQHDALRGSLWIDNGLATILSSDDVRSLMRVLVKDGWGNVGFEESSTNG